MLIPIRDTKQNNTNGCYNNLWIEKKKKKQKTNKQQQKRDSSGKKNPE